MRAKTVWLCVVLSLGVMSACSRTEQLPKESFINQEVRSLDDLSKLGLRTAETDQASLQLILDTVTKGLEENDYIFMFDRSRKNHQKPMILGPNGTPLVAIRRMAKTDPTCTTWISVAMKPNETEVGYGGRIGAATRGICGGIAAMHSLLLLNLVNRDDVIDGTHLKKGPLLSLQGSNRTQMTERRLRKLHEQAGAKTCSTQGGTGFPTNNRSGLERFNRELREKMNDPDHTWDCTVFLRTRKEGKWVLSHFEHVESVKGSDASTTITTTNGLDQGNQRDTVPASPGSNIWSSRPGQNPPFTLTGSTSKDGDKYMKGIPPVGMVKFLCCR